MAVRLSALPMAAPTAQKHIFFASGTHFCYRMSEPHGPVWPEGLGKLKKSTSLGLEPATFQLVA
jgi:hypothetical protein